MISQEDLSIKMFEKVQRVPGKKGYLTKHLWKLLKNLFIGLLFEIIAEEREKWEKENTLFGNNEQSRRYLN